MDSSTDKIEWARAAALVDSTEYLRKVGLLDENVPSRMRSVASYIHMSCVAIPLRTVIVAERPYATEIHPVVSSAMSYDPLKSKPTPSTLGVSMDVHNVTGYSAREVENWFRSSWMYLRQGVLCVNCTLLQRYTSSRSLDDVVPFQRWLRRLLKLSLEVSDRDIQVICMGTPATDAVTKTMKAIGVGRRRIRKFEYDNPAAIAHGTLGDQLSRGGTFGKPGTSRAIRDLVVRTIAHTYLPVDNTTEAIMSNQLAITSALITKLNGVANEVDLAFSDGSVENTHPNLAESMRGLSKALNLYASAVLQDYVASTIANGTPGSSKVSKATDWGNKREWSKGASTVGTSTKMTEVVQVDEGVPQRMIDDESDHEADVAPPPAPDPTKKVKKTKIVKRIVKRPKQRPQEGSADTAVPRPLTDKEMSTLRNARYYISDTYPNDASGLTGKMDSAINGSLPIAKEVRDVLLVAHKDEMDLGVGPEVTLGIDSEEVMHNAFLPKAIAKLILG